MIPAPEQDFGPLCRYLWLRGGPIVVPSYLHAEREGYAPLWQYFAGLRRRNEDDPISALKGGGPRIQEPFPCKTKHFGGAPKGAMMRFTDPSWPARLRALRPSWPPRWSRREGHAPVVAVLLASALNLTSVVIRAGGTA
jgi:hypothetical protein